MSKNLWILTEERPKREVIHRILLQFASNENIPCFLDAVRILPVLDDNKNFTFTYEVSGLKSEKINRVYIKSVSGKSSFVDYLLFYQMDEPTFKDIPLYAIEETKTDDSESRNTGVFQRASKFVYIDFFYNNLKKIMLYSLQIKQKIKPTSTNVFGTRCLLTLNVEILGKTLDEEIFKPFENIDELIDFKNKMRRAKKDNVPILITKFDDRIQISGKLFKADGLSHDPNIGALSLVCATLRKLGWNKRLVITEHGLQQKHVNGNNKFIKIANKLNIDLDGLDKNISNSVDTYWHYEREGEKLGTIFIHIVTENFTNTTSIFENHAGCEKGYFISKDGKPIALPKYQDRIKYKAGDKNQIIHIPDLVLIDFENSQIINIEGKKYQFKDKGISEIENFDAIEKSLIKPHYPDYMIIRTVVLYGSTVEQVYEMEVGFLLNKNGKLVLGINPPPVFKLALKNLIDYWSN